MSGRISLRAGFNRWRPIKAFLALFFVMPVLAFLLVALIGSKLGAMNNPENKVFLVVILIATLLPAVASLRFLRRALRMGDGLRIDDHGLYLHRLGRTIPWPDIGEVSGEQATSPDGTVNIKAYTVRYTDGTAEKETRIDMAELTVNRRQLHDALQDRLGPLAG